MLQASTLPRFKEKPRYDKYAGLLPCYDYQPTDRDVERVPQKPISTTMEPRYVNNPVIQPEIKELKEAPPIVKAEPAKKKKKKSIEGNNLQDITENIIKDKPPLKMVIKAFRKVSESIQDSYDETLFNLT